MLTMRKGQAAVEYLTTYGWAILALVIVIAVLFSSGVLTPNIALSEECQFGTSVPCSFAVFDQGGATHISLRFFNGFSYKIKVLGFDLKTADGSSAFTWRTGAPPFEMESGGNLTVTGDLDKLLPAGSVQQFYGNITYVSCAPEIGPDCGLPHSITGRVTGKILAGS